MPSSTTSAGSAISASAANSWTLSWSSWKTSAAGRTLSFWTQHSRELKDWGHWGQLNSRFDKRYRDPNDVLLEADLILKQRAQRAARKTAKKAR